MKMLYWVFKLSLIVLFFITTELFATEYEDVIYFKDGRIARGLVIEQKDGKVILRITDMKVEVYSLDEIYRITKEEKIDLSLYNKDYTEFGGTFGLPAGLQLNLGGWMGAFGIMASGMYWGDLHGFELDLKIKLSDNINRCHSLGLALGYSQIPSGKNSSEYYDEIKSWSYIGIVYTLNLHGFYLQPGISYGEGDFTNPQFIFQIGYVHRFFD